MPLSSVLSPLLRRGERKKGRDSKDLRTPRSFLCIIQNGIMEYSSNGVLKRHHTIAPSLHRSMYPL